MTGQEATCSLTYVLSRTRQDFRSQNRVIWHSDYRNRQKKIV